MKIVCKVERESGIKPSVKPQVNSATQTQKESDKRKKVDVKCGQRVKMEKVGTNLEI